VTSWDRPEEYDHLVMVADDEPTRRVALRERLEAVAGRTRAATLGRYPRFRVVLAADGEEAVRTMTPEISALATDLVMPRRTGLELIQELRPRRPDLAILAYTAGAPPSEAIAALLAGADHFLDSSAGDAVEQALDLAIDRRRLTRLIERSQAEVEQARSTLSRLGGTSSLASLPGLVPPASTDAVLPFDEAVHRYLLACAKLFVGDPRGLATRLGVSYFALRRLLKRYRVPFPGRSYRVTSSNH
jgi:CheY-like chemotaxis protein